MPEVRQVEREGPSGPEVNEPADLFGEIGLTIRRKAHDLELVAKLEKPEVLRQRQVEDAE